MAKAIEEGPEGWYSKGFVTCKGKGISEERVGFVAMSNLYYYDLIDKLTRLWGFEAWNMRGARKKIIIYFAIFRP